MKALACVLLSACSVEGVVLELREEAGAIDASVEDVATIDVPTIDTSTFEAAVDAQQQQPVGVCRIQGAMDGFYESFPDGALDARWLIADAPPYARANVAIENSELVLNVSPSSSAAIVTVDLFSSATYQVQGRVTDGVQLALWWRRDQDADGTLEIASPGQDDAHVLMRSSDGSAVSENQFALDASLADGKDHILRFDRYTTASPSVAFWVDDEMRWSTDERLPVERAGRMWIVASGTGSVRIANAFVTPFGNDGDLCRDGELQGTGLVRP